MSNLLNKSFDYTRETIKEVAERYTGFGSELFSQISSVYPKVYEGLRFYRASEDQTGDVFAVCEGSKHEFVIQLDPDIEVICIWGEKIWIEIGSWSADEYKEAIEFITQNFMS